MRLLGTALTTWDVQNMHGRDTVVSAWETLLVVEQSQCVRAKLLLRHEGLSVGSVL